MEPASIRPEQAARLHRCLVEGFWQTIRTVPGATRRAWGPPGDADLLRCDLRASETNLLFLGEGVRDPLPLLDRARAEFGRRSPWQLVWTGISSAPPSREIEGLGLRPIPFEPGMLLDPIPSFPAPPTGLSLRTVATDRDLDDWRRVWCSAFRVPRSVARLVFGRLPPGAPAAGVGIRLVVGSAAGRPVVCAAAYVAEGIAGIFSVGTLPTARGRGYGSAATVRAVVEGQAIGARSAFLLASPLGYPVYARLGFRRVHDYPSWRVPMGTLQRIGVLWQVAGLLRRAG